MRTVDPAYLELATAVESYFGVTNLKRCGRDIRELIAKETFTVLAVQLFGASAAKVERHIPCNRRTFARRIATPPPEVTMHLEPVVRHLPGRVPYVATQRQRWLEQWASDRQVTLFPLGREAAHGR